MPTLLWVNACIRGKDSRTYELSKRLLDQIKEDNKNDLGFSIDEVRLSTENLLPLNYEKLKRREELLEQGNLSDTMFDFANAMAFADMIVISAPTWNLMFPSLLNIFLEQASVPGITYRHGEDGSIIGLCKATDIYYVTTSGGEDENNYGYMYIRELSKMFGIENVHLVRAKGLDTGETNVHDILNNATIEN